MKTFFYSLAVVAFLFGCTSNATSSSQKTEAKKTGGAAWGPQNKEYITMGEEYLRQGDAVSAIKIFKQAIRENPRDPQAYFVLGQTYMRMKAYKEARESFRRTVRLDPTHGHAYLLLGGCYDLLGQRQEAIDHVQKSVEIFRMKRDVEDFKRAAAVLHHLMQPGSDKTYTAALINR